MFAVQQKKFFVKVFVLKSTRCWMDDNISCVDLCVQF